MKKQIGLFFLSSLILLSGCSSGGPTTMDDSKFDQKLNNLTGNQNNDHKDTNEENNSKVVENVKTAFWPENPKFKMKEAKVTKVSADGTIEVNKNEKVKMLGIRTTESDERTRLYHKMEPRKSEAYLIKRLNNQKVYLEINPTLPTNEKGETLAYIWIGDSEELKNVNALLLQEGLAVTERKQNITVYDEVFKRIENEALKSQKGLWKSIKN